MSEEYEQRIDRLGLEYVDACKQFEIAKIRVSDARLAIQAAQQERIIELEAQVRVLREALSTLMGGIPTDQEPVIHDLGPIEATGYDSFHSLAAVAEACTAYLGTKPDGE